MSDLPGHDHDPDPAALDELRRAFGDEATRPTQPNPVVRRDDEPSGGDRTEATPDEPVGSPELAALARGVRTDHEPTPPGLAEEPDEPDESTTDPEEQAAAETIETVETVETVETRPATRSDGDEHADEHADEQDAEPGTRRDAGLDDDAAADQDAEHHPDDDGESARESARKSAPESDGEHVEHDPTPEAEPAALPEAPAPTIIRIDDYSGSTTIDPDDPGPARLGEHTSTDRADRDADTDADGDAAGGGVISISVDDDLPDPVYVEGNLDRDGGGTIVFIENDETGDTLAPESERDMRRGIEPRMRERRVAVKRAQGRRRLKRVLLIVGIVVIVVGGLAVLGSPLFAVREDNVEIYGAVYSRGEEFDAVVDDAVGTPVLRVDTTQLEDDLEAIPWIEQAQVTTQFPYGLTIDVRERAAVSTYQGPDGRFRVLDRDGRVLDVIEDGYPYAYVLIGGPDAVDLEPGEFAPQGYAAASELAKNLTSSVRGNVVRIEVFSDGSRLELQLDDGSTIFFGEARDILAKLVRLEAVLANGEEREPGLIDVSTSDVTR